MELSFRGQYDKKLFYQAVVLANQPPRNRVIMNWFMLVFVLVAGAILAERLIESRDIYGNAVYISLLALLAAFVVRPFLQPRLAARGLWNNPSVQGPLQGTIDKRGIIYRLPQGENHFPWEIVNRMRKNSVMVTLVTISGLMLVFPKRFFRNEADWSRFNALVEKKIIPGR